MSMGYSSQTLSTISDENIEKIVGDKKLVINFLKKFDNYSFTDHEVDDLDVLADVLDGDGGDIDTERKCFVKLNELWESIAEKFKEATGIELHFGYNSSSCYGDELIDGHFFYVCTSAILVPTKEYKAMMEKFGKDVVEQKASVHFG